MNDLTDIATFIKALEKSRNELIDEYNEITERMQTYDVSAFSSELQSEFAYYSSKYFDEDKFVEGVKEKYFVDLTIPSIKEAIFDDVYYYSHALISIKALRCYIKTNNIMTEIDNEGMVYSS